MQTEVPGPKSLQLREDITKMQVRVQQCGLHSHCWRTTCTRTFVTPHYILHTPILIRSLELSCSLWTLRRAMGTMLWMLTATRFSMPFPTLPPCLSGESCRGSTAAAAAAATAAMIRSNPLCVCARNRYNHPDVMAAFADPKNHTMLAHRPALGNLPPSDWPERVQRTLMSVSALCA